MRLGISSFISDILSTSSNVCFCWTEGKVESNLHHPAAASLAVDVLWSKASGLLCLWVLLRTGLVHWSVVEFISHQSPVWFLLLVMLLSSGLVCRTSWSSQRVHTSRRCLSNPKQGVRQEGCFCVFCSFCHLLNLPVGALTQLQVTSMQHPPHLHVSHHALADMKQTQTKVSEYVHLSESTNV